MKIWKATKLIAEGDVGRFDSNADTAFELQREGRTIVRKAVDSTDWSYQVAGGPAVDFAPMLKIDELRLRVEALQRQVLVVGVDRAMNDGAIFEVPNEVSGEEAFSDAAFAVDDELICLFIRCVKSKVVRICDSRTANA